ncbi:MAG: FAD-binding protein [Acetobacteraceae bacterium]|nr:FAD-binding protein [Acetobacteraceae bacterium]
MSTLPIEVTRVTADVVVIGGGGAASRAALSARQAGADVRLVAKAPLRIGGSSVHGASEIMSMGAAGFGDRRDSPAIHYEDTMRAGEGFIDPALVRVLAEDAPDRIRDLIALGVPFDRAPDGEDYRLIRSDFGSFARALGVSGKTGRAVVEALSDELVRRGVAVDAPVMLVDLIRNSDGSVAGALAYAPERRMLIHYEAPSVVLGTGGMHGAFERQVSTPEMTGDGQAICFRHGAELVNLEFHQFGPALIHPYVQLFSKSCFVLHPRITNGLGEEFLPRYVPVGVPLEEVYDEKVFPFTTENVSRYIDVAIAREINEGRGTPNGCVNFSFAHVSAERIEATIPNTARWMRERGLDVRKGLFEVGIAFQCMNGGVRMVNAGAESTIPGLFVIGELAGGVRGPDRPGGNSLAEGQVFGHRAGTAAADRAARERNRGGGLLQLATDRVASVMGRPVADHELAVLVEKVRSAMQRHCLVEKSESGLRRALATVRDVRDALDVGCGATPDTLSTVLSVRNLALASELVLRACLHRHETRSAHYRVDFPETDDSRFKHSLVLRREGEDGVAIREHAYADMASTLSAV